MFFQKLHYQSAIFLLILIFLVFPVHSALGQTTRVTVGGVIGNKAILNIDGTPRTLAIGQEYQGVKLLNAQGQTATILIVQSDGQSQRITLRVGDAPFAINSAQPATQTPSSQNSNVSNERNNNTERERCIPAEQHVYVSRHGMFKALGYINGKAVDFIIDTGATLVSMDEKQAVALGITDYKHGQPITLHTANGSVQAYLITLESVRVGQVEVKNVQASVGGNKDIILLGNAFLSKLDIEMTPNRLVLRKTCP